MTATIRLEIDYAEGSFQRLIGLIERRGFHIDALTVVPGAGRRGVSITVRPRDAGRHFDVLTRQIGRLYGVRQC